MCQQNENSKIKPGVVEHAFNPSMPCAGTHHCSSGPFLAALLALWDSQSSGESFRDLLAPATCSAFSASKALRCEVKAVHIHLATCLFLEWSPCILISQMSHEFKTRLLRVLWLSLNSIEMDEWNKPANVTRTMLAFSLKRLLIKLWHTALLIS